MVINADYIVHYILQRYGPMKRRKLISLTQSVVDNFSEQRLNKVLKKSKQIKEEQYKTSRGVSSYLSLDKNKTQKTEDIYDVEDKVKEIIHKKYKKLRNK